MLQYIIGAVTRIQKLIALSGEVGGFFLLKTEKIPIFNIKMNFHRLTLSRKFRKQNPDSGNLWERDFRKQNPE